MAKLNKKTIRLIVGGGILLVLAVALVLLLLLLPKEEGEANTSSGGTSSDTSVKLVEQEQADVQSIHVKNSMGEYDIVLSGESEWKIEALDGFEQESSMYSLAAGEIAALSADKILYETQEELEKYGLDNPETVVTAAFKDGSTVQMNIGSEVPTGGNYMTIEGKDPIYIYSGKSYFDYKLTDFVSTTVFDIESSETTSSTESGSTTTEETQYVDRMEITRTDLSKPIIFSKYEEGTDEDNIYIGGTYRMTSPSDIFVDDSKIGTTVTGFMDLYAQGVEILNPTQAQIKERGLDNPAATVRVTFEGKTYTLKIGNAITCEATDDPDSLESGHQHQTVGYNVMRDGTDIIYNVSESSLPWLTLEADDIMSVFVVLPNIMDVKKVTVTFDGKAYAFEPGKTGSGDDEYLVPKYEGKTLEEDYFKTYYQILLSVYQTGVNTTAATGSPMMTIQYEYLDSSKQTDKLEFYDNGAGAYIMSYNGNMGFLTRVAYLNSIKEATAMIIQNKEPVIN